MPKRLAVIPRPMGGEWLRDEVAGWKQRGIDTMVCLLERHEVRELELDAEEVLCREFGINFVSFPIPDRGTPSSVSSTEMLVNNVSTQLCGGRAVAVHCRAGIGRTGVVGACILLDLGVPLHGVFVMLSRARRLPLPDTEAQIDWVTRFAVRRPVRFNEALVA